MSRGKNDKSLRGLEQLERLRQEFESMPSAGAVGISASGIWAGSGPCSEPWPD